jgi:hypothetical protein
MKTKNLKREKNDNTKFAFLPEMVLEHLNHAKPTEFKKTENSNKPTIQKITISAEPGIPDLDSHFENTQNKTLLMSLSKNNLMKTNVQNRVTNGFLLNNYSTTAIYTNSVQQETQSQAESQALMIESIIETIVEPIIFKC